MRILNIKIYLTVLIWQMTVLSTAICQSGYAKFISVDNSLSLNIDDILIHNDQLVVRGNSFLDSVNIWGLFVAGLDTNGVVLWHNTIFDSIRKYPIVTNTPSRFILSKKHELITPSAYFYKNNIVLIILDSLGHELNKNEYLNNEFTIYPLDIRQSFNSFYIFGRVVRKNYLSDVFVIKTDSIGKMIWIKYYGPESNNADFGDVIDNKNGTMSICSNIYTKNYDADDIIQGHEKPWIFTIDTSGAMIDQWSGVWEDQRTLGGGPFYHTHNGDWILISNYYKQFQVSEYTTRLHSSPTITKLDSNFNLLWKTNLTDYTGEFDQLVDMEYDTLNDAIIAAGNLLVWYGPDHPESKAWIIKVGPDGKVLWNITDTVFYNHQESNYTAGLALAPSGSIYVAGFVETPTNPILDYGWIIKVTPDGCTDTICTTTSIAEQIGQKDQNIIIYPNPVSDEIHILIKKLKGEAMLRVYDMQGRLVNMNRLVEGNNSLQIDLPPELYFYSVWDAFEIIHTGKFLIE